ncbi:hypothetical protein [Streptomyces sp. NPDC048196]|uniref:hypothetical protein n=1 Tax=Streptomyces sp. NPDC048196 TaxID=3154712 RepID=UPI0033F8071E
MRDNAPAKLKGRAEEFIRAVAVHNTTIEAVLADPHIRLMVLVDVTAEETRLQNTRVAWVHPDTQITITLEINDNGTGLYDGLLHELILHVVPAALKHAAAVAGHNAPVYPTTGRQIEAEERQEHTSQTAWQMAADIAVALGIDGLVDAVIMDACGHSKLIARAVVAQLLRQQSIDQEDADDLLEVINE